MIEVSAPADGLHSLLCQLDEGECEIVAVVPKTIKGEGTMHLMVVSYRVFYRDKS